MTAVPAKKPQSAYFIFTAENRQAIKDDLLKSRDKVSVGDVAKAIGAKWKALSDDEKRVYQTQAAEQKEAYARMHAGKADGDAVDATDVARDEDNGEGDVGTPGDAIGASTSLKSHSMLPLSMVKKLATSDTDVKRISADALKVITEATGLFLGSLAARSMELAVSNRKKNFKLEDMVRVAKRDPRLVDMGLVKMFEEEPFKTWLAGSSGNAERKRPTEGGGSGGKKKAVAVGGGIAAFFADKTTADDTRNEHET